MSVRVVDSPLSLQPPGEVRRVDGRRVLVVAPHFDDEVLGCGGLLLQLRARGARIGVLFLSDGSGGVLESSDDPGRYSGRRREEARQVGDRLGVDSLEMLDLPDGRLEAHLGQIAAGLRTRLCALTPDLLLLPSPLEISDDHRAAFGALHEVVASCRPGDEMWRVVESMRVLLYEVNHPSYPTLLVDVSGELDALRGLIEIYASQTERHGYVDAALGLRRFRTLTLGPGVRAAEAYVELEPARLVLRSPAQLVRDLGGVVHPRVDHSGPGLSVIVRTRDRPGLLREALDSLAASTHRRTEVVLVNDGGAEPVLPAGFPLPVVRRELAPGRGRAGAANGGIEAASGEFVCFLDDDDLVAPEHLETLAGLVRDGATAIAYTDAAATLLERGEDGTWQVRERRLPYSRDFDPDFLLLDNYIPLNTVIVRRELLLEVGPVDVELPFFEDWDLLIRLSERAGFHHRRQVTCEYRMFLGAPHHVLGADPRARGDFLETKARVLDKHRARLTPRVVARAVDTMRAESVQLGEVRAALDAQARETERWRGRCGELEAELAARGPARPGSGADLSVAALSLARRLRKRYRG